MPDRRFAEFVSDPFAAGSRGVWGAMNRQWSDSGEPSSPVPGEVARQVGVSAFAETPVAEAAGGHDLVQ